MTINVKRNGGIVSAAKESVAAKAVAAVELHTATAVRVDRLGVSHSRTLCARSQEVLDALGHRYASSGWAVMAHH